MASFCKVCVAIFLILSGYGLSKSWERYTSNRLISHGKTSSIKKSLLFVKNHCMKLMTGFWLIYIIFVPMGLFFNRSFIEVYDGSPLFAIADFLGVSYIFGTPRFNATWWYMGIMIVFYLIFPLLAKIFKHNLEFILGAILFMPFPKNELSIKTWLFSFALGMYLAKYDVFNKAAKKSKNSVLTGACCFLGVFITGIIRYKYYDSTIGFDGFFGLAIIFTVFFVISKIPLLNSLLEELGKYSAEFFMFHTFIFMYYFNEFIYWFKYPPVIFVVLTAVCYGIARLLNLLKEATGYNKLSARLSK